MNEHIKCPLCMSESSKDTSLDYDLISMSCDRCGKYEFSLEVEHSLEYLENKHLLSGVTKHHWLRHKSPLRILTTNLDDLVRLAPRDNDIYEKANRLLLALAEKTQHAGQLVDCEWDRDRPLAYCRNTEEFHFIFKYLEESGYFSKPCAAHSDGFSCCISVPGWDAIHAYKTPNAESEKVFVAMWFNQATDEAYSKGILPALENDCGYRAIRIDTKDFLGDIVDEIIAEIRESRFIVADFTGQRQGVYYEAGFASGMDLPVICTCKKDDIERLHFDTRQQNHIVWETAEDLRKRLANRIRAVIGTGPRKS